MTPPTLAAAITQGTMYILGVSGATYTWLNDERLGAGIIVVLTGILLITNIILNVKKITQSDKKKKK